MREKLVELVQNNPTCLDWGIESCDACHYGCVEDCYTHALVDHLITNDVVPVVRCKDCKWFWKYKVNNNYCCCRSARDGFSQVFDVKFSENDFCSYGERRTET